MTGVPMLEPLEPKGYHHVSAKPGSAMSATVVI